MPHCRTLEEMRALRTPSADCSYAVAAVPPQPVAYVQGHAVHPGVAQVCPAVAQPCPAMVQACPTVVQPYPAVVHACPTVVQPCPTVVSRTWPVTLVCPFAPRTCPVTLVCPFAPRACRDYFSVVRDWCVVCRQQFLFPERR